jgi:signal transduction histidine kinase
MLVYGKYRSGFAMVLLALAASTLAVSAWAYFPAFEQATLSAALGTVNDVEHLADLLFLQRIALAMVVVCSGLIVFALYFIHGAHDGLEKEKLELDRQLAAFNRRDWRLNKGLRSDADLAGLAERLNALAGIMSKEGGGDFEEVKSRFLEIISHQLRTPLTAVRWNLESLVRGELGKMRKRQEDLLRITSKNYQSILAMLSDWVEALELERGLLRLNKEPVPLGEFMKTIDDEFRDMAKLKRLRFTASVARKLPTMDVDKLKLRYILTKLLSNAMGYTPERGRVSLRVVPADGVVLFEVQDSGVGIPYEEQAKIFRKFFRASNANLMQPNASGVGLFVTKILIEAHGGTIGFESVEGQGTTFSFTLPIKERGEKKARKRG